MSNWVWQFSRDGNMYTNYPSCISSQIEEGYQAYLTTFDRYFVTNDVGIDFAMMQSKVSLPLKRAFNKDTFTWQVMYNGAYYYLSDYDTELVEDKFIEYLCNPLPVSDTAEFSIGFVDFVSNTITEKLSIKRVYVSY